MPYDTSILPKWAQEHIHNLELERNGAMRQLKEFNDGQTEAPISQLVTVPKKGGGTDSMRRYVQGHNLSVSWEGVELDLWLAEDGVRITFGSKDRRLSGGAALFPQSGNAILIREVEYDR